MRGENSSGKTVVEIRINKVDFASTFTTGVEASVAPGEPPTVVEVRSDAERGRPNDLWMRSATTTDVHDAPPGALIALLLDDEPVWWRPPESPTDSVVPSVRRAHVPQETCFTAAMVSPGGALGKPSDPTCTDTRFVGCVTAPATSAGLWPFLLLLLRRRR